MRWIRLWRHLFYPLNKSIVHLPSGSVSGWFFDLSLYVLDCLYLPELYKAIYILFKPGIRKLTDEERTVARSVFLGELDCDGILMDQHSQRVSKRLGVAYVTFGLIHCWKPLRDDVLIHELVHVFQYQLFGSSYIAHALRAQFSHPSYDYGGLQGLEMALLQKRTFLSFNFEQQASIIEHFYHLRCRFGDIEMNEKWSAYVHYWNELLSLKNAFSPNK
ncbi:MAG: hypothetical protein U0V54_04025 [Saprospiraceae bacterium]|nr:hypothetical protein [Saprospiraceae bacterium]